MSALTSHGQPAPAGVRVVVTVGTDHHPFDRLVRWVNDWLTAHPEQLPGFFVQSGSTVLAPVCAGSEAVDAQRLSGLLDSADVIVCHGGPASIAAAWARQLLPIVVPRLPQSGEHVDDHQVTFSRKLADLGRVRLAQTPEEFASVMAEATGDPSTLRALVPTGDVDAAVARFGELVDELIGQRRRRMTRLRPVRRGLSRTANEEHR
jgi:UDP-N-acetylglucosamine transferase subunit ALG13